MTEVKLLTNVKLEIGERVNDNGSVETVTALFHLKIEDGKIVEIMKATDAVPNNIAVLDMKGKLAVPTFKEMHNHLDKTYLSLDWKACIPVSNLAERLSLEAKELVELSTTAKQRATKMIQTLLKNGSTHIRTHVNIDPYIGLKNLEGVLEALKDFEGKVTAEVIAFPQHGLLRDQVPLLCGKRCAVVQQWLAD